MREEISMWEKARERAIEKRRATKERTIATESEEPCEKCKQLQAELDKLKKQIKILNENHNKYRNKVNKVLIEQGLKVDWDGPTIFD